MLYKKCNAKKIVFLLIKDQIQPFFSFSFILEVSRSNICLYAVGTEAIPASMVNLSEINFRLLRLIRF